MTRVTVHKLSSGRDHRGLMAKIQIGKTGARATSMEGTEVHFAEQLLGEVASTYDPKLHEAPLVIGHPTTDAPAFGWVRGLSFADGSLVADSEPRAELVDKVRAGDFKKISASFYTPKSANNPTPGKWYLRHVGFLGAMAPAVKGLQAVSFAEGDEVVSVELEADTASFGDLPGYFGSAVARLFGRMRDYFIDKDGLEKADAIVPKWEVDSLVEMAQRADLQPDDDSGMRSFGERRSNDFSTSLEGTSNVNTEQHAAALKAEKDRADAAEAELTRLRNADAASKAQQRRADCASFTDTLIAEARWPAGGKDMLVAVLDHLSVPATDGGVVSFGEGDQAKPLSDLLREQLKALPPVVSFGEHARHGSGGEGVDAVALGHKAAEHVASQAAKGITITAAAAVAHLQQQGA